MSRTDLSQRALALFDELLDLDAAARQSRLQALASAEPELHARVSAQEGLLIGLVRGTPLRLDLKERGVKGKQTSPPGARRLETSFTGYAQWFVDSRGWGDLPQGTALHWPIPYQELFARLRSSYTTQETAVRGTYGF